MKQITLKAVFQGAEGSMGFTKGQQYTVKITMYKGMMRLHDTPHGGPADYESLAALLSNWKDISMTELEVEPTRELTFGEKAVGITFNPGGSEGVNRIKRMCADYIDYLNDQRAKAIAENNSDKVRMYATAITEVQGSQMWGVKADTWQY